MQQVFKAGLALCGAEASRFDRHAATDNGTFLLLLLLKVTLPELDHLTALCGVAEAISGMEFN